MELACRVIEDLLPMYYDGICSRESAALVEEHLNGCPHCRQKLSDLRAEIAASPSNVDDMKPLRKLQKRYRKMRLGWWVALLSMLLLIPTALGVGLWRFWPQPLSEFMTVDESAVTGFSVYGVVQGLENGQTFTDAYRLDKASAQKGDAEELVAILFASDYRQDLRNLLPWKTDHVDGDKNYDGRTVTVALYTGDQEDDCVRIQFLSSSIVAVSTGNADGFRIYHPTDRQTMDALMGYLQTHGTKS